VVWLVAHAAIQALRKHFACLRAELPRCKRPILSGRGEAQNRSSHAGR